MSGGMNGFGYTPRYGTRFGPQLNISQLYQAPTFLPYQMPPLPQRTPYTAPPVMSQIDTLLNQIQNRQQAPQIIDYGG